jgi:hypothetical protein
MVILVAKNTTGSQWAQFFLKALTEIEGLAAIATPRTVMSGLLLSAIPLCFLVAGPGFEPGTFGL